MKPRIGYSIPFMTLTTNWIHNQLVYMQKYEPIAYADRIKDDVLSEYLSKYVYYSQDLNKFQSLLYRALRKYTGMGYDYYLFKKKNIVLIHSHFGDKGFDDLNMAQRLKIPHIVTFYGYDISLPEREPIWKERYDKLFEGCDAFLTEGSYMKKCLVAMGCPEEKVTVQHLGVDIEKIPYIPREIKSDGRIRILASATFKEKKGLPYAIEAFALVREKYKNLEFLLIGGVPNGNDPECLKEQKAIFDIIEKYKLKDSVKLLGYLKYDEYIKVSHEAQIFISPSVTASNGDTEGGAPVSIIEMSAAGMPILSTYHCDIPEVVIDNVTGLLVPERDVESLAEKLEYLISHPRKIYEMGKNGRQYIQKEYSLKRQVEKLEDIYDTVISDY